MKLFTIYCRIYQGVFRLVSPLLPWREPELLEGPGSLLDLPDLVKTRGAVPLLIVTDRGLTSLGLLDPFLEALKEKGVEYHLYDKTVPNPTIANIEEAAALYREKSCRGIVALGGGSPMDCAKAAGARIARPRKAISSMKGVLKVLAKLPPLFAVPTTAGTGSEATLAAVVSNPETHEKYAINDHALIPRVAVLDPELTTGLPPHITSTTGMDALTHAVEAYIGRSNTAGTEAAAVEACSLIFSRLLPVYQNGKDLAGRQQLLKAAYLAGKAFTRAYVGNVHAMAHTLGGFYGVPHGLANSVILPHVLRRYGTGVEERLARLARLSGVGAPEGTKGADGPEGAESFIRRIEEMNRAMGIPEGFDCIQDTDIPLMADRAFREANPLYPVPVIFSRDDFINMYHLLQERGKKS